MHRSYCRRWWWQVLTRRDIKIQWHAARYTYLVAQRPHNEKKFVIKYLSKTLVKNRQIWYSVSNTLVIISAENYTNMWSSQTSFLSCLLTWRNDKFEAVSVGMSRIDKIRVVFIEPSSKMSNEYYCQFVLSDCLLTDLRKRYQRYWYARCLQL